MDLIGLSGKAGAGKDYVGRILAKEWGYKIFSFAHALKMEGVAHGFTYEEVFVTKPENVRSWLQRYGVERREEDCDYWVRRALQIVSIMGWQKVVFTDVRFPNEAVAIMAAGGRVFRVDGRDRPSPLMGAQKTHVSETAMDEFPAFRRTINNPLGITDDELIDQLLPALEDRMIYS